MKSISMGAAPKNTAWRIFLARWLQSGAARSYAVKILQSRTGRSGTSPSVKNPHVAALSAALNADRGTRAHAVHLVIVEQTLEQGIAGGLNAIPAEVMAQAASQLARLSGVRASLELQLLLQCMHQIVDTHVQLSKAHKKGEFNERRGFSLVRSQPKQLGEQFRIEPSRRPTREPAESFIVDDDFPDTEAFSDCEADIPLPMPLLGRDVVAGKSDR